MAQAAMKECDEAEASGMGSHGTFCWNELMTHDPAVAKNFYAETIGWTFDPMPMQDGGTYWVAKEGPRRVGGVFEMTCPSLADVADNWMPYLAVDDVDARAKKALDAGATLMRPLFDIPGVGRIAILRQPGGACIGWMTPVSA